MDKVEAQFSDYKMLNEDCFEDSIKKNLLTPISKELQQIDKSDLLVSGEHNSLDPSVMAHKGSKRPQIETAEEKKQEDSNRFC